MDTNDDGVLKVIAFTLQETATQNELLSPSNATLTRFHTLSPPKIHILKYLRFLKEKTKSETSCFVMAMIYIDRLLSLHREITVTPTTVHKLFLTALLIATKFHTDIYFTNSLWASCGGVRMEEMNILECEFLFLIQFSLVISQEDYNRYVSLLGEKAKLPIFS